MVDNPFPISFPIFSIPFNAQILIPLILFCLSYRSFCWHCEMWSLTHCSLGGHSFIHTVIYNSTGMQELCSGAKGRKCMVKSTVNVGVVSEGISENSYVVSTEISRHIHRQYIYLKWGAFKMGIAIKCTSCSSKGLRFHSRH